MNDADFQNEIRYRFPSMVALQPVLAFPSLDFPNRTSLTVHEIASKLRVTPDHVVNLIDQGALPAEPARIPAASRRAARVSVRNYQTFVTDRTRGHADFTVPRKLGFPSLEFLSDAPLLMQDIAVKLSISAEYVVELIVTDEMCAVDLRGEGASRGLWRIPIESYRRYLSVLIIRGGMRRHA